MNKKEDFLKAMNFRHACKIFDETKKISDEDMHYILEADEHFNFCIYLFNDYSF